LTLYGPRHDYEYGLKANLLLRRRIDYDDGAMVEMVRRCVPSAVGHDMEAQADLADVARASGPLAPAIN